MEIVMIPEIGCDYLMSLALENLTYRFEIKSCGGPKRKKKAAIQLMNTEEFVITMRQSFLYTLNSNGS